LTYFQERWSTFVALAPPLTLRNFNDSSLLKFLADDKVVNAIVGAQRLTKNYEFMPANWVNSGMMKSLCAVVYDACLALEKLLADTNPDVND
jgi:hypothetical protein